ncbi:MAG: hypothetical protein V1811_01790, partial [Candidatus Micrarchaeota archaeon]
ALRDLMKIAVVSKGVPEVAKAIESGAVEAGAQVSACGEAELIFVNASETQDFSAFKGKKIAVFFVKTVFSLFAPKPEKIFEKAQEQGASVANTLALNAKGFAKTLSEEDFARAKAFGERTVRNISGSRPEKSSEKRRIKGYLK